MDFDYAKDKIIMVAVNAEKNKELLADVPYQLKEDLALIYKVKLETNNEEMATVTIHNNLLKTWGATKEEIHELAMKNTREVTEVRLTKAPDSDSCLAYGSITFDGDFVVCGIRVLKTKEGNLFVGYPSKQNNKTTITTTVTVLDKNNKVLEEICSKDLDAKAFNKAIFEIAEEYKLKECKTQKKNLRRNL